MCVFTDYGSRISKKPGGKFLGSITQMLLRRLLPSGISGAPIRNFKWLVLKTKYKYNRYINMLKPIYQIFSIRMQHMLQAPCASCILHMQRSAVCLNSAQAFKSLTQHPKFIGTSCRSNGTYTIPAFVQAV